MKLGQFRELTADLSDDCIIRGYEGEGGAWVIVSHPDDNISVSVRCNDDDDTYFEIRK